LRIKLNDFVFNLFFIWLLRSHDLGWRFDRLTKVDSSEFKLIQVNPSRSNILKKMISY
jgi:hypothetical protein